MRPVIVERLHHESEPGPAGPRSNVERRDAALPPTSPARPASGPALPGRPAWQALATVYELDVVLLERPIRAEVEERIEIANRSSEPVPAVDLSILAASYGEFELRRASIDGSEVTPRWTNSANLRFDLPQPMSPGGHTVIRLAFSVRPSADVEDSQQLRTSDAEGIVRFGGWFPVISDGHPRRNPGDSQVTAAADRIRLSLRLPPSLIAAAPGRAVLAGAGRLVYELDDARDLAFSVSERYRRYSRTVGGATLEADVIDPRDARPALDAAEAAFRAYSTAYGPHSRDRFVLAASARTRSGSEYPGIVFLGSQSLRDPVVVAHELAHQWFYDEVGNDQIREPWIDEAFAEFSAEYFFGHLRPSCSTLPVDTPATAFPDRRAGPGCDGYDDVVYRRGAELIHRVRLALGDDRFFATMRDFVRVHGGTIVTTADVERAWLDASDNPPRLESMLREYLRAPALAEADALLERSSVGAATTP